MGKANKKWLNNVPNSLFLTTAIYIGIVLFLEIRKVIEIQDVSWL